MKRTEKKNNENNTSYLTPSITLGCRVAFVALCVWLVYRIGVSAVSMIGIYILIHSVIKIIRLSIRVIFSLLSILFLLVLVAILVTIIF